MGHAIKAKRYFTGLDPVCCPRCQRPIDSIRRAREVEQGACSVCTTPREQEEATAVAALDEANQRANEARSVAEQAPRRHDEALRQCW
jgi:predicted amidophosphoribosyltransferase